MSSQGHAKRGTIHILLEIPGMIQKRVFSEQKVGYKRKIW
jgi:hypothetical protein